jgi:hypothetical protein
MLKTYRIIPLVFILCLFGFTLITVSPVIAEEPWNPSMGMCHNSRPCIKQNVCGAQCAPTVRKSKGWMNPSEYQASRANRSDSPMSTSTSPSGGEVAELNARIAKLEAENARLLAPQGAPADSTKMVAQRDGRIRVLTQVLREKFEDERTLSCKLELLTQRRITLEQWDKGAGIVYRGHVQAGIGNKHKLMVECYGRIGEKFEIRRERFMNQLGRIQKTYPIDGETNTFKSKKKFSGYQ